MALLDRFRAQSGHKNPDAAARLQFVQELPLDERDLLTEVAREDSDPRVRRAAVAKLMDPVALAGVAKADADEQVRVQALSMLRDIALEAFEGLGESDSLAALAAIDEPKTLIGIAKNASREATALAALARVADGHALGSIARHFSQQLPLVERQLLHELQADGGVGILVARVSAESIKQCHTRSSLTPAGASACEFGQLRDDVAAVGRGADLFVDVQNAAVRSDVKRPARCEAARPEHAVGPRHLFVRVAQNRVRELHRLREPAVGARRIHADSEITDAQPPQIRVARPERLAFGRSAAGERLGKPGEHDRPSRQLL